MRIFDKVNCLYLNSVPFKTVKTHVIFKHSLNAVLVFIKGGSLIIQGGVVQKVAARLFLLRDNS